MADFVAVLKKTIDGLGETTPETRTRVYDKARATIAAKLAAINPPPPEAVIERQKVSLEQAIKQIEAEYSAPPPPADEPPIDDFEAIIKSLEAPVTIPPPPPRPAAPQAPLQTKVEAKPAPVSGPSADPAPEPSSATPAPPEADDAAMPPPLAGDRPTNGKAEPAAPRRAPPRNRVGLAAVALILFVFAGATAYALWFNRGEVSETLGLGIEQPAEGTAEGQTPPAEPAPSVAATEPAAPAPSPTAASPADTPPGEQAVAKFTQKLNPDGTETDSGPAGGNASVGEGTSVAELTAEPPAGANEAPAGSTPAAPSAPSAGAPAETPAPAQGEAAVPVGQRAIFYEERTSASGGSAQSGSTVWSLVQESPGGDQPLEPAIRADVTIPGKEIQLRMTIRRNGDPTLPASHIVELIFLTPDNFEGGVIDNLLRMTMKETEEATGNPVLGVPAKIGDGFFLIALSDGKPEQDANMQLFRRMKWIDIPIVYRSGRRALMTLERGIPGDKVFEEATRAWSQLPPSNG